MSDYTLIVGNLNYSSWSLRAWLAAKYAGIRFDEVRISMFEGNWRSEIAKYSGAGRVPILKHGALTIHDSLSIVEYLAEQVPGAGLWPKDKSARAVARSISAEMHSSFQALREHMPMNMRASFPGKGHNPEVDADIERVFTIWRKCRARFGHGGPFLFGEFCNADIMFAPVVTRFVTFAITTDSVCQDYIDAVVAAPVMVEAHAEAAAEPWSIAKYEGL